MNFDNLDGDHVEIEWVPQNSARASRVVLLEPKKWQVSIWSDPVRYAEDDKRINYAWDFVGSKGLSSVQKICESDENGKKFIGSMWIMSGGNKKVPVCFYDLGRPELNESAKAWIKRSGGTFGGESLKLRSRSYYVGVSETTKELVRVLGEVVLEKVRAKSLRILKDQVRASLACDVKEDNKNKEVSAEVTFRHTCALLDSVRLETLSAQGDNILRSLLMDFIVFVFKHKSRMGLNVVGDEKLGDDVLSVLFSMVKVAIEEDELSADLVFANFIELAYILTEEEEDSSTEEEGDGGFLQGVKIILAVSAYCHSQRTCDARQVKNLVVEPYFKGVSKERLKELKLLWYNMEEMIIRISAMVDLDSELTPRERMLHLNYFVFSIIEKYTFKEKCREELLNKGGLREVDVVVNGVEECDDLIKIDYTKSFFEGIIKGDVQQIVMSLLNLLRLEVNGSSQGDYGENDDLVVALRVVSALAAFLEEDARLEGKDAEVRRAARKRSLELLIEAATDRSNRDGDIIIGFHGTVYGGAGKLRVSGEGNKKVPLGLNLGLSADFILNSDPWWAPDGFGLHLDPLDLGGYANFLAGDVDEFEWRNVFRPSLGVVSYWGDWDVPFFAGCR